LCCASLGAQSSPEWRFLELSDGLSESFIRNITIAADGRAWIRHSGNPLVSLFDGQRAVRILLPGGAFESRIHGTKSGVAWTLDGAVLHEYRNGGWTAHKLPRKAIQIAVSGEGAVFCLFPDSVARFRSEDGSLLTLLLAAQARVGNFREIAVGRASAARRFGGTGLGPAFQLCNCSDIPMPESLTERRIPLRDR